jgi:hypothetical protein
MQKYITAEYINNSGAKATGLTPTITIQSVTDNSVIVNAAAMTEIGNGFYKYLFANYDSDIPYVIICDGGVTLTNRYCMGSNSDEAAWDFSVSNHEISGSFGSLIQDSFKGIGL